MTPQGLLAEAARRGIELYPDGHTIRYRGPKTALADLKPKLAAHKGELLTLLRAAQDRIAAGNALAHLQRLKTYTLPAGRMAAAREIAWRCGERLMVWANGEPADLTDDPIRILHALQDIERELVALGGAPDPELADAIKGVTDTFPGATLVAVRKLQ